MLRTLRVTLAGQGRVVASTALVLAGVRLATTLSHVVTTAVSVTSTGRVTLTRVARVEWI